jgi:hypothetical protein
MTGHPCADCPLTVVGDFSCGRCDSPAAFGSHSGRHHRDAQLRCARCNAVPLAIRAALVPPGDPLDGPAA